MKAGNGGSKLQAGSWLVLARLAAGSYAAHVYAPESQVWQNTACCCQRVSSSCCLLHCWTAECEVAAALC